MHHEIDHNHASFCLSWKPIFAGAFTAIGLGFLLNLFSVAIGLTAFTTDSGGVETLAFGGLIASCIGIIASMFASGWIAGYLGSRYCTNRNFGALYGFLAWVVALIIMMLLLSYIQNYIYFYTHFISGGGLTVENLSAAASKNLTPITGGSSSQKVIISTYILFVLFFLGAFAASLGGHVGMVYEKEEI